MTRTAPGVRHAFLPARSPDRRRPGGGPHPVLHPVHREEQDGGERQQQARDEQHGGAPSKTTPSECPWTRGLSDDQVKVR
ncbi:hypothetical protein STTU_1325 [Streptomyces sp. Tu6071]|nr:hypothetical protein STTU_1325 [Streptomyces sp. Tu6071]